MEKSTKEKILVAARKLFTAHGFAGTSIGKIASEAQVNHSLIFHYFHNKEQLWLAVKQAIVEEACQYKQNLPDTALPFEKFLRDIFIENMRFYRNNPDIVRMISWQRLEYNQNLKIGVTLSIETRKWLDALSHYQKKGEIQAEIKPEFIMTLILSIISSAALDPNVFIQDEKNEKDYLDVCIGMLTHALML